MKKTYCVTRNIEEPNTTYPIQIVDVNMVSAVVSYAKQGNESVKYDVAVSEMGSLSWEIYNVDIVVTSFDVSINVNRKVPADKSTRIDEKFRELATVEYEVRRLSRLKEGQTQELCATQDAIYKATEYVERLTEELNELHKSL